MARRQTLVAGVVAGLLTGLPGLAEPPTVPVAHADTGGLELRATAHPPVPRDLAQLWLVPSKIPTPPPLIRDFARGVELIGKESFAEARPLVAAAALSRTPYRDYAAYYTALVDLRTGAPDRARAAFAAIGASTPSGVLAEWSLLGEATAAEQAGDVAAAAALYARLASKKPEEPAAVLAGLARTRLASGDRDGAVTAWREVYYGHPLSAESEEARSRLRGVAGASAFEEGKDLARAERLFQSRRYAEALAGFEALSPSDDDAREVVALRRAECQFYLGRHREAAAGLQPFLDRASRKAEARFFHLSATRGLGDHSRYVALARAHAEEFKDSPWVEETLNNLATHYILVDEDPMAATVFAEYLDRFPRGRHGARASWKLGWWRYRQGDFAAAATIFDRAAAAFPRSDYRPAWIYWSGRAWDRVGEARTASARFALVVADYLHSYYGRLAEAQLRPRPDRESARAAVTAETAQEPAATAGSAPPANPRQPAGAPQNAEIIRQLVAARLHATADAEVRYAQRQWGTSPLLEATRAYLLRELGQHRPAINTMKRAYPQFLSDEGHLLPAEARRVIFPMDYWPLIQRYSGQRGLDPYLIAALVAQESSFDPVVVSSANAYGLMQIVPSTGRRLARSVGIRRFNASRLTDPETNVKLGTLYFKNLVRQFGGHHYALASYNAGESRVVRWIAERGTLPQEEFIDDIPFPETQMYVKKILGTAEDYRQLYGPKSGQRAEAVEAAEGSR